MTAIDAANGHPEQKIEPSFRREFVGMVGQPWTFEMFLGVAIIK